MRTPFPTFGALGIIFILIFVCVIAVIVVFAVRGVLRWSKNNQSPILTVPATVVSKRTDISQHMHPNPGDATGAHGYHNDILTTYYATFQVESGDRMELNVQGHEFGMLAEGDRGMLTFQGTRYLGFERR